MKRFFKRILISLILLFLFLYSATWIYYRFFSKLQKENFIPSIRVQNKTTTLDWIPVHWTIEEFTDRAGMFLPIYVDTIKKPFWVQFDLGTSITDFADLSNYFPGFKQKEILLNYKTGYQNKPRYYQGFKIRLGDSTVYQVNQIPIYDQLTPDSLQENDTMYNTKIGNIGYDFIQNRILVIDYRNSRIAVTDSLSQVFEQKVEYFERAITNQKPIFLPIKIDGKIKLLQFDNGSSAFTFWTSVDQWNQWRKPESAVDTLSGYSWGNKEYWYRSYPKVKIEFLNRDVTRQPIWAVSKPGMTEPKTFLQKIKAFTDKQFGKTTFGIIGNEYFRNDIIIIDTKSNKFGRLKN